MTTASIIVLTNLCGSVAVDTQGGRVVSYIPVGEEEILAQLSDGTGGMPLCWPWFSSFGPAGCRRHGLARYHEFDVVCKAESPTCSELVLKLESNELTYADFKRDFRLTVAYRLTEKLSVEMTGENTGTMPFRVTEAFHPYFRVGDIKSCRTAGLGDSRIGRGPRLVDFPNGQGHVYSLTDSVLNREIRFVSSGDRTVVLWNPGAGVSRSSKMTSVLTSDEWRHFVCIENGTTREGDAYSLRPGERHKLVRIIQTVKKGRD